MNNLTEHKCKGKCSEYKGEQCKHCLILGDDKHLDHHLSPNCRVMDSEESIHYLRALEAQREVS
ncbi:hypothetical protein F902_02022 [Acinetobacter higginsii]|uniref:Uncharacterized protein n=1 Tax=Acinetobacter higginsii TaxID=70347 RepID=N9T2Q9_9GAMM|nr:hypothetical protein F902_02022 [Acinetobacter higginsii]